MINENRLSGWGRTSVPGRELRSEQLDQITSGASLTRGLGRSYGDASLPAPGVLQVAGSALADRILGFDASTGVLRAEAGLCLAEMNRLFLPRGFFTPVTPGTKFVTLRGMIASDVHGKNHHRDGTIGKHVRAIKLRVADGRVIECSRSHEPELFFATLGGIGLTGHILEVELVLSRVPSRWIYQESFRLPNLESFLRALKEQGRSWPFTVGWMDTLARGDALGRGLLMCGRWAEASEAPAQPPRPRFSPTLPFEFPSFVLNKFSIGAFNTLLYHSHIPRVKRRLLDPDAFFYPLDFMLQWNRMYGKRGVAQHQSVIPDENAAHAIRAMFEAMRQEGSTSFLTVVKDCGPQGEGLLSFPRVGMSVALDMPIHDNTQRVIDRLNECVIAAGGRIYLTKDGFSRPEHVSAMDARVTKFLEVCRRWDPHGTIRSAQSQRLFGVP